MILVTGANGFLGSFLCKSLIEAGHPVRGLVRKDSDLRLLEDIKDSIDLAYGDILDAQSLENHFEGVKTVIHSAAIVSFHKKDFLKMSKVNIEGTRNIVNLASKYQIDYFIHISSVAAIGRKGRTGVVSEKNQWEQSKWNSHYGESKYLAELEVWRSIQEGLSAVILNPSVVLGPGNWDQSSSRLFKYVWQEKKYYSDGMMNYVDIRDLTSVVTKFLATPVSNERYIISAGRISYKDFFSKIASQFNKKPPSNKANPVLLKFGLIVESFKSIFTSKRPLITRETIKLSGNEISFDNNKIKKELNFNFTPLEETVDWTCSEYLKRMSEKID